MAKYDYLIVGAGLFGSVFARLGAVRCEQFNDFCQAARQQKHQKVGRHRCRKAGHKAFPQMCIRDR